MDAGYVLCAAVCLTISVDTVIYEKKKTWECSAIALLVVETNRVVVA